MTGETLTIAQNGTISDVGEIRQGQLYLGILVPTINTAILYIQVGKDRNSAETFTRLQLADGSGDLNLASGTGGKAWVINLPIPFRYFKIEASASQTTAARTFTYFCK